MNPSDHQGRRDYRHDDERTRARCLRLLIAHMGEGGMRMFLRQPQPDLGERTGAELLGTDPDDLLRRLGAIEAKNHPYEP